FTTPAHQAALRAYPTQEALRPCRPKKMSVERGPVPSRPQQRKPSPSHSDFYDYKEDCSRRQVRTRIDPCCGDPRVDTPFGQSLRVPDGHSLARAACSHQLFFSVTRLNTRPFLP